MSYLQAVVTRKSGSIEIVCGRQKTGTNSQSAHLRNPHLSTLHSSRLPVLYLVLILCMAVTKNLTFDTKSKECRWMSSSPVLATLQLQHEVRNGAKTKLMFKITSFILCTWWKFQLKYLSSPMGAKNSHRLLQSFSALFQVRSMHDRHWARILTDSTSVEISALYL